MFDWVKTGFYLPTSLSTLSTKKILIANYIVLTEAVIQRCSVKTMFLKILQNSQENT